MRTRFSIGDTIDGYEVVDTTDGRAVTNASVTANRPLAIAANLNAAVEADEAEGGCQHLRIALGCIEEDDELAELGLV